MDHYSPQCDAHGSAEVFDARIARVEWLTPGYHFVIDNVPMARRRLHRNGPRWIKQMQVVIVPGVHHEHASHLLVGNFRSINLHQSSSTHSCFSSVVAGTIPHPE